MNVPSDSKALGTVIGIAMAATAAVSGCQDADSSLPQGLAVASVSYMTLDEFRSTLEAQGDTVLVEFCVPSGCFRCDAMRDPIDRLASDRQDGLKVRRMNIRQYPQLAWEFGITHCPSYVAFRDGVEVLRSAGPTSADLIESGLDQCLSEDSADQLTLAIQ